MSEERLSPTEAAAEAFLFMLKMFLMIGVVVGIFYLRYEALKDAVEDFSDEVGKPVGHLVGRVEKVETWDGGDYVEKDGNMTLTLGIKDRTRITFEDGRSKEFLGIPKEPVPKDKDIVVVWTKYNILLEIVDAEEYKQREAEKEKKKEAPDEEEAAPTESPVEEGD